MLMSVIMTPMRAWWCHWWWEHIKDDDDDDSVLTILSNDVENFCRLKGKNKITAGFSFSFDFNISFFDGVGINSLTIWQSK